MPKPDESSGDLSAPDFSWHSALLYNFGEARSAYGQEARSLYTER
jgi:hypothetical protein